MWNMAAHSIRARKFEELNFQVNFQVEIGLTYCIY